MAEEKDRERGSRISVQTNFAYYFPYAVAGSYRVNNNWNWDSR